MFASPIELVAVLGLVLLLFGGAFLPSIGKNAGKTTEELRNYDERAEQAYERD